MTAARAGLLYGGLAFLAGAALGPLREAVLAPRIGALPAALAEAAAMAGMVWLAARRAMARIGAPVAPRDRMIAAATGLVLLLALEAALGLVFALGGLAAARAPRSPPEQAVGLGLLAWFAALPFLVRRHAVALP